MTENITTHDDDYDDIDAWLDGAHRNQERVSIYSRPDLASKLDELEQELDALTEQDEESLGNPQASGIRDEIEETYQRLIDSKKVFIVESLSREEVDELGLEARETARDQADKASANARKMMAEQIAREGIKDAKEKTDLLRRAAREASAATIAQETSLHILAKAIVQPKMTPEQVKRLADKIGDGQLQKLLRAFNTVSSEDVEVSVPKSLRAGTTVEDETL